MTTDTLSRFEWVDLGLLPYTYPYLSLGTQNLYDVFLEFDGFGFVISAYRAGVRSILGCFAEEDKAKYAFCKIRLICPSSHM